MRRLVVGISGSSGSVYGIRLLEALKRVDDVETHLVMTGYGKLTVSIETDHSPKDVEALADVVHAAGDVAASISSGSFRTHGMIVAPCSMNTLSAIVHSQTNNLLCRAADVTLKEGRRLVLMPREAPLHVGHCKLMYEAAKMGALIAPPMPAFYAKPKTVDDIVNHSVGRALDLLDIEAGLVNRWVGHGAPHEES